MKLISSAFFFIIGSLLVASCSLWSRAKYRIDDKPVLSELVQAETKSRIDFARHVAPILEKRCVWCHDGSEEEVPYVLTNQDGAFQNKRIVPGKPEQSLLFVAAEGEHPVLKNSSATIRVAPGDAKVLERWIISGAIWPSGEAGQLKGR